MLVMMMMPGSCAQDEHGNGRFSEGIFDTPITFIEHGEAWDRIQQFTVPFDFVPPFPINSAQPKERGMVRVQLGPTNPDAQGRCQLFLPDEREIYSIATPMVLHAGRGCAKTSVYYDALITYKGNDSGTLLVYREYPCLLFMLGYEAFVLENLDLVCLWHLEHPYLSNHLTTIMSFPRVFSGRKLYFSRSIQPKPAEFFNWGTNRPLSVENEGAFHSIPQGVYLPPFSVWNGGCLSSASDGRDITHTQNHEYFMGRRDIKRPHYVLGPMIANCFEVTGYIPFYKRWSPYPSVMGPAALRGLSGGCYYLSGVFAWLGYVKTELKAQNRDYDYHDCIRILDIGGSGTGLVLYPSADKTKPHIVDGLPASKSSPVILHDTTLQTSKQSIRLNTLEELYRETYDIDKIKIRQGFEDAKQFAERSGITVGFAILVGVTVYLMKWLSTRVYVDSAQVTLQKQLLTIKRHRAIDGLRY